MLASATQGLSASRLSFLLMGVSSSDRERVSHRIRRHETSQLSPSPPSEVRSGAHRAHVSRVQFASRLWTGRPNSERRAVESTAAHRYVYSRARGRSVRRAPRFRRHLRRIVHELVNNGVGSVGCGLWRSRGYGGEREVSLDEKIEI